MAKDKTETSESNAAINERERAWLRATILHTCDELKNTAELEEVTDIAHAAAAAARRLIADCPEV